MKANRTVIHPDLRLFSRYVIPSMLSMVTAGIYTLVDGLFVSWGAGSNGMAALNVAYPLALLLVAVGEMIGIGGAINIAVARGRNQRHTPEKILRAMILLIIPCSIALPVLLLPNLSRLLPLVGATPELLPAAREYAAIVVGGGFFQLLTIALLEAMRNDNAPVRAMGILVCGLVANIVLDYFLVLHFRFGVAGSAWATVLAQACCCALALHYFLSGSNRLRLRWARIRMPRIIFRRIVVAGIPSFGIQLSIGAVILLHNRQALQYGGVAGVAAYAIISYVEAVIFLIIQGIALGIQPIVSYLHGAGEWVRRQRIARYGMTAVLCCGTLGALISMLGCQLLPLSFNAQGEVLRDAANGLLLSGLVYPFLGFQKLSESYFQSMERPGMASLLIYLDSGVILPAALFILPVYFGLNGVWLAMPTAKLVIAVLAMLLWLKLRNYRETPNPWMLPDDTDSLNQAA